LGLDYKITDKFSVGGSYDYTNNPNNGNSNDRTLITGNPDYDLIATSGYRNIKRTVNTANLHGIYKIDSIGKKLSVDLNYLSSKNNTNNFFDSSYFLENQLINNGKANNLGGQNMENYSVLADMEHPTKFAIFNYGGKISFSKTDNTVSYYDLTSGNPILDPNNTDHFVYKENNEALYFSADKKFGEKWETKAGLRMENTQIEGNSLTTNEINKRNYTKFFPTAYLSYNINENNSLSIDYGRRIQRPNFWLLNPFRWYVNLLSYSTGDPSLQPSFTHNLEFSYTHKDFSTTLYYSKQQDDFEQITVLNNNDRTQITTPYNCLNSNTFGWKGNYTFSKLKWWESMNEFDLHYADFKAIIPVISNKSNIGWNFYFSTDNTFYFDSKKNFALNVNWWYASKGPDQMDYGNARNELDVTFKMNFLNKNLTVSLKGQDITGSNRVFWTSYTNNIKQIFFYYGDYSQYFSVSLSYKLGNNKLKIENHNAGNEEEKGRL
jgi:hypothetical protein